MATLTNTKIKDTYDGLLKTTDNDALGGTYKLITDGLGNSSGLYLGTGGRLGIGTSSPNFKTHLYDTGNAVLGITAGIDNYAALQFGRTTDTTRGAIEYYTGDDSLRLKTGNNTERLRIDSSGNVGIGTSSPTADLSVGSTSTSSGDVHLRTTKTTFSMTPSNTDAGGMFLDVGWASGGQGPFIFGIGGSEKMRIESSGLVRIQNINNSITFDRYFQTRNALISGYSGTNEAKLYLHRDDVTISSGNVLGELNFSGADGGSLVGANVQGIAAGTWGSTSCPSDLVFSTASSGSTSASERMRIDSSGNVQIGSGTRYGKFDILNIGGSGTNFIVDAGSNGDNYFTSGTSGIQVFRSGSTERMRITSAGRIHFYNLLGSSATQSDVRYDTTSKELFYNTSSERYKTDIVDLENTLDKVNSLRSVRYKDIETEQETTGLIAEEVIEIIPEVVFKKEIEGFDEPQPEGINYSDFAPFLIKAIQELKAEIETLKSQINS